MRPDVWYRSPVNPNNPVLVWTDGTTLFFGPSNAAVTAGRAALPDDSFSPLPGYSAEEIQWDRVRGVVEPGPLLVIARNPRAPDYVVSINEDLVQTTDFVGLGVRLGSRQVTREGTEFIFADATTVPLAFSEAAATGAIYRIHFRHGFFRYRGRGGSDDLYVARGADPAVYLVERSTGTIRQTFASGSVNAVVPLTTGVVGVETTTGTPSTAETVSIDLRTSPATTTTSPGHATSEAGYTAVRERLVRMGVVIVEEGVRFREAEITAVENALTLGGNRGLTALQDFHALPSSRASDPLLRIEKTIGPDGAHGTADILGANLWVREPFDEVSDRRVSTVRHEMTHVIMNATDAVSRHRMSSAVRTTRTEKMRERAEEGRRRETAGSLWLGERGAGDPTASPVSVGTWRRELGHDSELATIFLDLLEPCSFIPDPEGTGDRRGVALADESRYSNAPARVGHPSENVREFVASFVTSATLYRTQFEERVLMAELAGNRGGARAGTDLRRFYEGVWTLINRLYVPLGSNPFNPLPVHLSSAFIHVPSAI